MVHCKNVVQLIHDKRLYYVILLHLDKDVPYCEVGNTVVDIWLKRLAMDDEYTDDNTSDKPSLHPLVQDFKELIEKDAEVNIFFSLDV